MACNGQHPRVGIFAIISDEQGRLLMGRRLSKLGRGHWGFPGGHLEQGEGFFECVQRETLEETGLHVLATKVVGVTNDVFNELDKHYVTVFTECSRQDNGQQPETLEPQKCEGWVWKTPEEIRIMAERRDGKQQLFLPVEHLVLQGALL
ncbi:NUDIX hydrolase domain-like protein [Microdochium trichocladiopsis]|uniref:NUDIX hydrolase domain-like protein n=1 Tax=Microdochium trichocladiopsis TaxID=1682393 RepID=A0A9P8XYR8_9PEZI|nr:NUDIX hydrolase domain-like protein [Microdochium trichocladiopsis]KAH7021495.1 NUDIX hydrolase domain-like protein [Microdochium trichocladiopsis]